MLVNHVTDKTDPMKFPAGRIREQVIHIQDPYKKRIERALERINNAVYQWQYLDAVMIYTKLTTEDAGKNFVYSDWGIV